MLMYCSLLCKLFFGIDNLLCMYNNSVETDFELIIIVEFIQQRKLYIHVLILLVTPKEKEIGMVER